MWRVVLTLAVNCSLNLQMQHVVSGAELGHSLPELETNLRKISQLQYVDMKLVGMPYKQGISVLYNYPLLKNL